MARYSAFLRGISPTNAKMPELRRAFENAGFKDVRTVLASGNVLFDARKQSEEALARKAEEAMRRHLGRTFRTIVRSVDALRELLEADPFANFRLPRDAKRVVTFLREAPGKEITLPIERDGARILAISGREVYTAYVPSPRGPVFMALLEKTFGTDITTRTWNTVEKCVNA
jgi:uncharacterized protein (DUF1697 family)